MMTPRITSRPLLPSGHSFLSRGRIIRCIFCDGIKESYLVEPTQQSYNIGIAIKHKIEKQCINSHDSYLNWWKNVGNEWISNIENETEYRGNHHVYFTLLTFSNTDVMSDLDLQAPLNQDESKSLLRNLILIARKGASINLWPTFDIGTVVLRRTSDGIVGLPLFFIGTDADVSDPESMCVESLAHLIYLLSTGINSRELSLSKATKKNPIHLASHWNRSIDNNYSLLLNACIDKQNPIRIQSLQSLEDSLREDRIYVTNEILSKDSEGMKTFGFAKVAGMTELKKLLTEEVINPIRNPGPYERFGLSIPNGILLFGPPGCGKTFIARQLAEELNFNFLELIPSEIASPFIHDTVLKIRNIFIDAEEKAPSIIFIDEFEALVPARSDLSGTQQYKSEEVNEFLVNLNDCATKKVFVVAATNEPEKVDGAICRPGRLDKLIYVGPPDLEARIELLKMYIFKRPATQLDFNYLAQLLEGYSCVDIKNVVDDSARLALKAQKSKVDIEDIAESIRRNSSSLNADIIVKYAKFKQRGI